MWDFQVFLYYRACANLYANSSFFFYRYYHTFIARVTFRPSTRPFRDAFASTHNDRHRVHGGYACFSFVRCFVRAFCNGEVCVRCIFRFRVNYNVSNVRWYPFIVQEGVFVFRFFLGDARAICRGLLASSYHVNNLFPMVAA